VRESRDRVRAALKTCGYDIPPIHIPINPAPADIRKEGLSTDCERLLERAMTQHGMTARAHDRIQRWPARSPTWKAPQESSRNISPKRFSTGPWIARFGQKGGVN
jgi:hypothetical protein